MTTKTIRRSAAEIIAFHFCADIADVREMIYQPTVYANPNVYCWGDDYYCCPTARQKLPSDPHFDDTFKWIAVGHHYGRTVYESKAGGVA